MLIKLKESMKQLKYSNSRFQRLFYLISRTIYQSIYLIKKMIIDKGYRHILLNKLFNPNQLQQTTITTSMNRYPEVFSSCQEYFGSKKDLRILSYGCSTGEELVTIRHYFPESSIVGVDINPHCLSESKKKTKDDSKIEIMKSDHINLINRGAFDVVFCMAVLQRTPSVISSQKLKNIKHLYDFEKFDKQLQNLNEYVKEEGLLVAHYTPYLFNDSLISKLYSVYGEVTQKSYPIKQFDIRGNILPDETPQKTIHIKNKMG